MATPLSSKKNVRVLYDYTYEEKDGSRVSIKAGDECILVKKTDADWWLVLRCGEKKGIYIPANYLQEIHMTTIVVGSGSTGTGPPKVKPKPAKPPPIPKKPKPPLVEDDVLKAFDSMLDHALDEESDDVLDEPPPDYDDDKMDEAKKCDKNADDGIEEDDGDYINVAPKVKAKAKTDANANRVRRREPTENYENVPFKSEKSTDSVEELDPNYENTSTDLPDYANLGQIQEEIRRRSQIAEGEGPQSPEEGATADRILVGGWEQHCDSEGRTFYFNPVTKESQWEPPTGCRISSASDRLSVSSVHSLHRITSIPAGWTEQHSDTGDMCFVNEVTKERWQSSVDSLGRVYYFRENSSGESSWQLPQVLPVVTSRPSSLRANLSTARSLLTMRWRRSSWSSFGGRQHVVAPPGVQAVAPPGVQAVAPPGVQAVAPPRVSPIYNLIPATVVEPKSVGTDTDGASSSTSPRMSPGGSTEDSRPVATRLKEHRGTLNKKKLVENNKKLRKNWSQCYVVTTGEMLYFYKDQKATTPKPSQPMGKPEVTIDLRDAEIKFRNEADIGRKNVFKVRVNNGTDEYFLQSETPTEIHEWIQTLTGNIESLTKCTDRPGTLPLHRSADTLPTTNTHRRTPSSESAPATLTRRKTKDQLAPPLEGTNNSGGLTFGDDSDGARRFKDWLSNWFKKRPPVETLRAKGIFEDAVFGSHLMSLCIMEDSKVPQFVTGCIAAIEDRGLTNDGLYRVSGNLAEIQKLKFTVNQDHNFDLVNSEFDLHVLTGALKMFFRELKEPLFPFDMFDKFMAAIKTQNKSSKAQMFRDLIKVLPPVNKETMRILFEHLLRVVDHSRENRMQIQNVAIVFGPTLLSPETPAENITTTLVLQNQIVDLILHEFKRLF